MSAKKLQPTLGLFSATMLAISIVVGAGMLVLPGLVYREVGSGAVWSWVGDTLVAIPLLWVFVRLGKQYPSAGGVSGFVAACWPKAKVGTSFVLLGTFSLGIPAIALTGGQYLLEGVGIAPTPAASSIAAFLLLVVAASIVFLGAKLAGVWQNIVVGTLLAILVGVVFCTVPQWSKANYPLDIAHLPAIWHGMALAFFSYTGWEMFASIAEDMRNPRRDFPLAVCVSFALIGSLYVGVALAIESVVPANDPALVTAPLLPVLAQLSGNPVLAAQLLGSVVSVIIFSNLVGAVWAASRMVFDLGRNISGIGSALKLDTLHDTSKSPRNAIVFSVFIFGLVLLGNAVGALSITSMLWLAGQNFFVLYVVCVVVFLRKAERQLEKMLAFPALVLLFSFGAVFSIGLIYPLVLFAAPYLLPWLLGRRYQVT